MRRTIFKTLVILALITVIVFGGCREPESEAIPVTGVTLSTKSINLIVGNSIPLLHAITIIPSDATNKNVIWSSSNPSAATVSKEGLVYGVAAGTATVTVKTEDGGFIDSCIVQVSSNEPDYISINFGDITEGSLSGFNAEQWYKFTSEANKIKIHFWSDLNIQNGFNLAVYNLNRIGVQGQGQEIFENDSFYYTYNLTLGQEYYLQIISNGNYSGTYGFEFIVPLTGFTLNKSSVNLISGDTEALFAVTTPSNATYQNVTWHSSNPSVAMVSEDGVVTAFKTGQADIMAYTYLSYETNSLNRSLYAWCAVYVTGGPEDMPEDRFEYFWIDEHGSLVTTSGGATTIAPDTTLTITAQSPGYSIKYWYLNGINTGETGNYYIFSSSQLGKHVISLAVEKDGKLYNTNITITVAVP